MIITKEDARLVAAEAMEYAGYEITDYCGYYEIWVNGTDPEDEVSVAINKTKDNGREYFTLYVSPSVDDEGLWAYTDALSVNELANKLVELAKNEDMRRIANAIQKIENAPIEQKESLFNRFVSNLRKEYEGIDCVAYESGSLTDQYINFDSNCGLSLITAIANLDQMLEYGKPLDLSDAIETLSEIGERSEYWNDLVDEQYHFTDTPEHIANAIVSIRSEWIGEERFVKDIKVARAYA